MSSRLLVSVKLGMYWNSMCTTSGQALARLQHGAQLAVVRRALAHVLQLDLDVRVGLLEHLHGLVGARRPRPHRDGRRLLELGRHVDLLASIRRHHAPLPSPPPSSLRRRAPQRRNAETQRPASRQRTLSCLRAFLKVISPPRCSPPGHSPRAPGHPMLPARASSPVARSVAGQQVPRRHRQRKPRRLPRPVRHEAQPTPRGVARRS